MNKNYLKIKLLPKQCVDVVSHTLSATSARTVFGFLLYSKLLCSNI